MTELKAALAERTSDLQRLQAEYVNYKRRVDRDRDLSRKVGIEGVLKDLLSVLDDLRSAREHGELTGGFKAVGDEVERITGKYGLVVVRGEGRPLRPAHPRGAAACARRGHRRPDLRGDPAARLQGRRPDPAARPGSRWPSPIPSSLPSRSAAERRVEP